MNGDTWIFLALCGALLAFLLMASFLSKSYSLDRIKSKTVGDGQHGTARWATPKEIGKTYHTVPFRPRRWRKGKELPTEQGLILGSVGGGKRKSKAGILLKISRKLLEKLRRPVAGKQKRKPKKKSKNWLKTARKSTPPKSKAWIKKKSLITSTMSIPMSPIKKPGRLNLFPSV